MSEYGDIFDYQLSATGFEYLNFGFMAAYGLLAAFIIPITSYLTIHFGPLFSSTASREI